MIKRILCWAFGGALFLNGFFLLMVANANLGYIGLIFIGALLMLMGCFYKRVPHLLKLIFILGLLLWLCFGIFLFGFGRNDTASYQEDAIIILGAGIKGDRPTTVLRTRLDAALLYHQKNPQALLLVSGGQGPQETVSEAAAMAKYLIAAGVPKEQILLEEQSTSTLENFAFSKEILDAHFEKDYKAAFISNDFHILRARGMAKATGLGELTHIHSHTPWYNALSCGLRESLAILKFWVLGP